MSYKRHGEGGGFDHHQYINPRQRRHKRQTQITENIQGDIPFAPPRSKRF